MACGGCGRKRKKGKRIVINEEQRKKDVLYRLTLTQKSIEKAMKAKKAKDK